MGQIDQFSILSLGGAAGGGGGGEGRETGKSFPPAPSSRPQALGTSATCSPEFHIKAVLYNKLTDENTISLSTVESGRSQLTFISKTGRFPERAAWSH